MAAARVDFARIAVGTEYVFSEAVVPPTETDRGAGSLKNRGQGPRQIDSRYLMIIIVSLTYHCTFCVVLPLHSDMENPFTRRGLWFHCGQRSSEVGLGDRSIRALHTL